jgi:hypothetical protein
LPLSVIVVCVITSPGSFELSVTVSPATPLLWASVTVAVTAVIDAPLATIEVGKTRTAAFAAAPCVCVMFAWPDAAPSVAVIVTWLAVVVLVYVAL